MIKRTQQSTGMAKSEDMHKLKNKQAWFPTVNKNRLIMSTLQRQEVISTLLSENADKYKTMSDAMVWNDSLPYMDTILDVLH